MTKEKGEKRESMKRDWKREKEKAVNRCNIDYLLDCHKYGNVKVLEKDNLVIMAGGITRGARPLQGKDKLTLDLGAGFMSEIIQYGINLPSLAGYQNKQIVRILWPDMSIPEYPLTFWEDLVLDILNQGINQVLVCCEGGHGRTGTCLAILTGLLIPDKITSNPIDYIRDIYCIQAIETMAQEQYIQSLFPDYHYPQDTRGDSENLWEDWLSI